MSKNYSYVSLLTDDSYSYGIILLIESMKKVETKYPLHVLVTNNVSFATLELLNQLDITYELIEPIPITDEIFEFNKKINSALSITWKNCWTKFKIFDLVQFDKIVFLDADVMLLKNLDHLFEKPHMTSCLDGEYFDIWPDWPHFNTGCLVIEPSHQEFDNILTYAKSLKAEDLPKYVFADQEVLNFYYKDWINKPELHLDKYYDIFPPYIQKNQVEDIQENGQFLHFVGRKPWTFWIKTDIEIYSEYFYAVAKNYIENILTKLDWEKIREKLVLTVYAICKNEINNIKNFLNSFCEADYVCILDTGSTDGTWEYLQEQSKQKQNLIIDQQIITPWRYDTARNISMELIPKETDIFFMADIDELIKETGWCQIVKNAWDPLFDRGTYDYHRDLDENGNIIRTIKEHRIHNRKWTHWSNIVHEAICTEDGEKRFFAETCHDIPIEVWHYAKHKKTNYMELCEQALADNPEDEVMRLQLAIEYELRENIDKALQHYKYLIQHQKKLQSFELARCFNGIARIAYKKEDYRMAEQFFLEGRLACDCFADNYVEAMEMFHNIGQFQEAITLGKLAFRFCSEAFWCGNYDMKSYYPYYIMGLCYWGINDLIKAIGYLEMAYVKNPSNEIRRKITQLCFIAQQAFEKKELIEM